MTWLLLLLLAAASTSAAMYCLRAGRRGATSHELPGTQSAKALSTGPKLRQCCFSSAQSSIGSDVLGDFAAGDMLVGRGGLPCLLLLLLLVCALLPDPAAVCALLLLTVLSVVLARAVLPAVTSRRVWVLLLLLLLVCAEAALTPAGVVLLLLLLLLLRLAMLLSRLDRLQLTIMACSVAKRAGISDSWKQLAIDMTQPISRLHPAAGPHAGQAAALLLFTAMLRR
jgi:hypothetical protein